MIEAAFLGACAFGVSLLTLFSGFGLGTLLMPAFALFFPLPVAVAATAVVHGANNLFKAGLLAGSAPREILLRFGIPAVVASVAGAFALATLAGQAPLWRGTLAGLEAEITPLKLALGLMILAFGMLELVPAGRLVRAPARWLPLGGLLSGFFGGLSGHQGALRAVFLAPLGLEPRQFAATQAVLAVFVDAARLVVYGGAFVGADGVAVPWSLVGTTTLCAFAGAWLGKRLLPKVTVAALRGLVAVLLLGIGAGLAAGLI